MKEEDRQRAIRHRLARMEITPGTLAGPAIPTGFGRLDRALGVGGFPRGRITELFGPSSSGKTTLLLQAIAHLQANGLSAAWIDADHTFDPSYATRLGVAIEHLPLAQPDSAEQALEIVSQLASSGAVDLLVIDSAAALTPQLELEAGIGQGIPDLQSRVLASGLRRLSHAVGKTCAAVVFLNQTRLGTQASRREAETSAGGPSLKLYAAIRVDLSASDAGRVRFRILKNKVAAAFTEGELEWRTDTGFTKSP